MNRKDDDELRRDVRESLRHLEARLHGGHVYGAVIVALTRDQVDGVYTVIPGTRSAYAEATLALEHSAEKLRQDWGEIVFDDDLDGLPPPVQPVTDPEAT